MKPDRFLRAAITKVQQGKGRWAQGVEFFNTPDKDRLDPGPHSAEMSKDDNFCAKHTARPWGANPA